MVAGTERCSGRGKDTRRERERGRESCGTGQDRYEKERKREKETVESDRLGESRHRESELGLEIEQHFSKA